MTDPTLADALRTEVGRLRADQRRRVFAARIALGEPGRRGVATVVSGPLAPEQGDPWPPPAWLDAGLRLDVVDRVVAGLSGRPAPVHAWLLRPGVPSLHDEDLAWLSAVRHGCDAVGLEIAGFWVVTRFGWLDPVSGESRAWKRLRVDR